MGPQTITLFDIAVFGAVSLAIVVAGFIALLLLGWRYHTLTQNDLKESLRLTRALGSLVVQEAGKIRAAIGR
jgi:hypothetical protein